MIEVMGVLMGIDLQAFSRPEGSSSDDLPSRPQNRPTSTPSTSTSPPEPTKPAASSSTASSSEPHKSAKVEEDVPMEDAEEEDPEAQEEKKARVEAGQQKKLGSEAYKKREFAVAAAAFEKAWDLWPKDITFLTNLSGTSWISFCFYYTKFKRSCLS